MGRRLRHRYLTAAVAAACLAAPAGAVVRTVGPTGTYATIQAAVDAAVAAGGGVHAYLRGSTEIRLVRNRVTENRAEASTSDGTGVGGGIWVGAEDSARVRVEDNRIQGNATQAVDNQNTGSGAYLTLRGGASGRFYGNTVTGNTARRLGSVGGNGARLTAAAAGPEDLPVDLNLELPLEATGPQDDPGQQPIGAPARQAPPGAR